MATQAIETIFGAAELGNGSDDYTSAEGLKNLKSILLQYGVTHIDSAQIYGISEQTLGEIHAGDDFVLDTKWPGGAVPGSLTRDNIIARAEASLRKLCCKKINIFYIHSPDPAVDYEEVAAAVDEVHRRGIFEKFGLSNFSADDTQKIYNICKDNGYVLPSVYQGTYSAVARRYETILLPILRRLNIAFYSYAPLAGGFLTKTKEQILEKTHGRFTDYNVGHSRGGMYLQMYGRPSYLDALAKWEEIARTEGISRAELAYRWVGYNSALQKEYGDAIIIGARNLKQLEETLEGLRKGSLSDAAVEKINAVWESIKHEAPLNNAEEWQKLQG